MALTVSSLVSLRPAREHVSIVSIGRNLTAIGCNLIAIGRNLTAIGCNLTASLIGYPRLRLKQKQQDFVVGGTTCEYRS